METSKIEFTRINRDVNGNPRYVVHFLSIPLTDSEINMQIGKGLVYKIEKQYAAALKKAKKIGGRKFHNKQFGGGIVFQSYNINDLEKQILSL